MDAAVNTSEIRELAKGCGAEVKLASVEHGNVVTLQLVPGLTQEQLNDLTDALKARYKDMVDSVSGSLEGWVVMVFKDETEVSLHK